MNPSNHMGEHSLVMGRLTQRSAMLALAVTAALAAPVLAGPKYWDTDASGGLQGSDGQWDTGSTSNWSPNTAGAAPTTWADDDDAFFQTGGTYTVTVDGTVKANSLSFTSNSVVTLDSSSGGGTIQVASGGITAGNGYNQPATINAPLTLDGSQIWQTTGGYSLLTVNGNIGQAAPGAALTFTGTKPANPGTVTLTGTNTYSGGTTINGGLSVKVGSDSALGSGVVHLNGILDTTATSVTLSNDIVVADGVAVSIKNNGGAGGSQTFTLNGDLSGGAGSSISLSAGLYNFGGDNSGYSGTINNNQGITLTSLDAGSANAVWAGNNIYGAIKLSSPTGGTVHMGGLSGAFPVISGNNHDYTLVLGEAGQTTSTTGAIGGKISLVMSGSGTQTLAGANTYGGTTTVNGGTLLINGSLNVYSAVSVNDGGTFGGTSSVGSVTVADGGHLAPGAGTGSLELAGTLNLAEGASYDVEIAGTVFALNGTEDYDRAKVTGAVDLGGAVLNVDLGSYLLGDGDEFGILQADGALAGTFNYGEGATILSNNGYDLKITYLGNVTDSGVSLTGGNDVVLYTAQAVPEPGTLTVLGVGLAGLIGRRRRR